MNHMNPFNCTEMESNICLFHKKLRGSRCDCRLLLNRIQTSLWNTYSPNTGPSMAHAAPASLHITRLAAPLHAVNITITKATRLSTAQRHNSTALALPHYSFHGCMHHNLVLALTFTCQTAISSWENVCMVSRVQGVNNNSGRQLEYPIGPIGLVEVLVAPS